MFESHYQLQRPGFLHKRGSPGFAFYQENGLSLSVLNTTAEEISYLYDPQAEEMNSIKLKIK